ncbi:hypothetical protein Tco_1208573 [Tanacetum coccineum]
MKAKKNLLENVEDLTSLEDENKTRTIINLKEKNEHLLKRIQEINLKRLRANIAYGDYKLKKMIQPETAESAEIAENAEIAESAEIAENAETAGSAENFKIRSIL